MEKVELAQVSLDLFASAVNDQLWHGKTNMEAIETACEALGISINQYGEILDCLNIFS